MDTLVSEGPKLLELNYCRFWCCFLKPNLRYPLFRVIVEAHAQIYSFTKMPPFFFFPLMQ